MPLDQAYFISTDRSETGLAATRSNVISRIYPSGVPTSGIDSITLDVTDPLTTSPTNLDTVDQATLVITGTNNNTPYIWHPTSPNGDLVIMHNGHTGIWNVAGINDCIVALVEAGYTVVGIMMPDGITGAGSLHNDMFTSVTDYHVFTDATIRIINEYEDNYTNIYMVGLSGGGWSTCFISAIEERISKSVDILGTLPLYCVPAGVETGRDWEQSLYGLTDLIEYTELYLFGSLGTKKYKQIIATTDPTGFNQTNYNKRPYLTAVDTYTDNYSLVIDPTDEHLITPNARQIVVDFFNA